MGCNKSKVATPLEPLDTVKPPASQKSIKNQRTAMVWESDAESTALASGAFEVSEVNEAVAEAELAPAELTPIECEEEVPQEKVKLSQSEVISGEGFCGFC
mmetsp:Transcript_64981/g.79530  ORF Transcript_64981/g.79530 Transcript_64981/m.79530 type:complete len:101 (-) Transcript_64981:128-430(-)